MDGIQCNRSLLRGDEVYIFEEETGAISHNPFREIFFNFVIKYLDLQDIHTFRCVSKTLRDDRQLSKVYEPAVSVVQVWIRMLADKYTPRYPLDPNLTTSFQYNGERSLLSASQLDRLEQEHRETEYTNVYDRMYVNFCIYNTKRNLENAARDAVQKDFKASSLRFLVENRFIGPLLSYLKSEQGRELDLPMRDLLVPDLVDRLELDENTADDFAEYLQTLCKMRDHIVERFYFLFAGYCAPLRDVIVDDDEYVYTTEEVKNFLLENGREASGPFDFSLDDWCDDYCYFPGPGIEYLSNIGPSLYINERPVLMDLGNKICQLTQLTLLEITDNPLLRSLPENIGNLVNLTYLIVIGNEKMRELPESIGNLKNLEFLDIGGNSLQDLPSTIGNLEALEELDVSDNDFRSLPSTIVNLTNLLYLNILGNPFEGGFSEGIKEFMWNLEICDWAFDNPRSQVEIEEVIEEEASVTGKRPHDGEDTGFEPSSKKPKPNESDSSF